MVEPGNTRGGGAMELKTKGCPLCAEGTLQIHQGSYSFEPPENVPGGTITIDGTEWFGCDSCNEEIIPDALSKALGAVRYKRLGLLAPEQIRAVRQRTGLTAVDGSRDLEKRKARKDA